MRRKITKQILLTLCDNLNRMSDGAYTISFAYGGASLHKMCFDGCVQADVFGCGHIAKRDLHDRIQAVISFIYQEKKYWK